MSSTTVYVLTNRAPFAAHEPCYCCCSYLESCERMWRAALQLTDGPCQSVTHSLTQSMVQLQGRRKQAKRLGNWHQQQNKLLG